MNIFTWENNQRDNKFIQAKLDRFLVSNPQLEKYQYRSNKHLLEYASDHYPILLFLALKTNVVIKEVRTTKLG